MTPGPLRPEGGLVHTGEAAVAGHRRGGHRGGGGGLCVRGTMRGHAVVEVTVRRGHRGLHLRRAHRVVIRPWRPRSRFAVGALSGLLRRRRQRVPVAVHHLDSEGVGQRRREQLRVGAGELLGPRQALLPRPHHLRSGFGAIARFLLSRLRGGLFRRLALIRLGHHRRHGFANHGHDVRWYSRSFLEARKPVASLTRLGNASTRPSLRATIIKKCRKSTKRSWKIRYFTNGEPHGSQLHSVSATQAGWNPICKIRELEAILCQM